MASIETRIDSSGNKSYRAKVRQKGHPSQSATFKRLTDAKRWATQTEAAIREGRHFKHVEAKRHTLLEAIERYRRERLPKLKDAKKRSRLLDWWVNEVGSYLLADLSPARIAASVGWAERPNVFSHKQKKQTLFTHCNRYDLLGGERPSVHQEYQSVWLYEYLNISIVWVTLHSHA